MPRSTPSTSARRASPSTSKLPGTGAPGCSGDERERTEFIALSLWESENAIRAFAGDDIGAVVLYPEDQRYVIGGDSTVTHYQVVDQAIPTGGNTSQP